MPSVLRAVLGVMIFTPHAVKPSVWLTETWKPGELRSVILYMVKLSAWRRTIIAGTLCCCP